MAWSQNPNRERCEYEAQAFRREPARQWKATATKHDERRQKHSCTRNLAEQLDSFVYENEVIRFGEVSIVVHFLERESRCRTE
jgi:hypothetical protein